MRTFWGHKCPEDGGTWDCDGGQMHLNNMPMKIVLLILFVFPVLLLQGQYTLQVNIEDVRSEEGVLYLALYDNSNEWLNEESTYRQQIITPRKGTMSVVFNNLPAGTYALSVLHDKNRDKKLNTNWVGMPSEAYGFSNNPGFMMRAPRFSECVFTVSTNQTITIDLVHW
jgi:uncharacterized protein (DUF2141 family)